MPTGEVIIWAFFAATGPANDLLCKPKYSRVNHAAICLTARASWMFGPATRQLSQVHQQIYNKMALKEKN